MRYLLIVVLLAGCAKTRQPEGGFTTKNGVPPQAGEMAKDWDACLSETTVERAFRPAWTRSSPAFDCMYRKGWK